MYLDPMETKFTPARRTMVAKTRASKLAELYQQLTWLNDQARLPFLVGDKLTHADLTWLPTMVFVEYMLPRSFGWSDQILKETTVFPKLTTWYQHCLTTVPALAKVRQDIWEIHEDDYSKGRLSGVKEDVKNHPEYKWKYM
jgi:glutathione S-transferase